MFFKALPKIFYPWKASDGVPHRAVTPDIFRRVQVDKFFKNRLNLVAIYLDDLDTPESVAYKYYGSTKYHWIVLLSNNIIDVEREWPLSNSNLEGYIKDKYGANNGTSVHHYVDSTHDHITVDWDATRLANGEIKAVTNNDYEEEINNNKRQIFLLDKIFLKDIVAQYKKLVR